jgi:tetratricopeptide (TPR) repeat protein
LPAPPTLESKGARFRLFEAVSSFLRAATSDRPLVIALDDLHAADEPSLLLLRFVVRELADSRLLVLCALRDVDPTMSDPLVSAIAELVRERQTTQIELGGLSRDDVAEYIELSTGITPPPRLVETIHAETEGNPLFVAETVRLLDAEDQIADPEAHLRIPPGVRAVIDQRIGRLSDRCRDLLVPASVLGREFGLDPLARLSDLPRGELLDVLDEAVGERILGEVPGSPDRLRFGHALIRDTLYDELTAPRRMQLHQDTATALERAHSDDLGPYLSELAHHYLAAAPAGAADKAVDYARLAGDRAASQLAFEEAARQYEMALSLVDDEVARCDLLLALGDAQARAGNTPSSKRVLLQAAELAEQVGDPERLATAALGYGGRIVWEVQRDDENFVPLLERALAAVGNEDSEPRVKLLARISGGGLRHIRFPPERRFALARESLDAARRLGDPATLAYALDGYIPAVETPENVPETLALANELLDLATDLDDKERLFAAHEHRHERLVELGEIPDAEADLAAMARIAEELRQPAQLWLAGTCRARLALLQGRFAEAEDLIEDTRAVGEQAVSWNAEVSFRLQMYVLRREQGRLEEVAEMVRRSVEKYPEYPVWRCVLAQTATELGDEAGARRELKNLAADDFAGVPFTQDMWLLGLALLAEVAGSLGDRSGASALHDQLLPYADRVVVAYPELSIGAVSRYLGILAATTGRWDDAERHFEAAVAMNKRIGAQPWLQRTRADYERMLASRA